MNDRLKQSGFSLTEVLIAVGILSIGMMLVATMFPVAVYLTAVASERTMAAIVADEAFAKIQLYGVNISSLQWNLPRNTNCTDYEKVFLNIDPNEFAYPAVDPCSTTNRQYYWSALCRQKNSADNTLYQIIVFVARKTGPNFTYQGGGEGEKRPKIIKVNVQVTNRSAVLTVLDGNETKYVNPPATVLDNATGRLYRVIDRQNSAITLDRTWEDKTGTDSIWLIPPSQTGGKNADIEVYQRIIRF